MGNVRSVTCTRILNARGHDSLAVGWLRTPPKTLKMLAKWADTILYLDSEPNLKDFLAKLAPKHRKKVIDMNIGYDRWSVAMHPHLVDVIKDKLSPINTLDTYKIH